MPAEQQLQVGGEPRRAGIGALHQRRDGGGGQLEAAIRHGGGVGAQARVNRQRGDRGPLAGGERRHDRPLAPGARLAQLAGAALELGREQLAQPGAMLARRLGAARVGEHALQLALRLHSGSVRVAARDMDRQKLLRIYVQDHFAGSTVGLNLARRSAGANRGTTYGDDLARIADEIDQDRQTLEAITDQLDIPRDQVKNTLARGLELAGRLKLNGQLTGYSPLSRLVELEGLITGISGKISLWRALLELVPQEPRLDAERLQQLIERGEEQRRTVEELRTRAVRDAFVG